MKEKQLWQKFFRLTADISTVHANPRHWIDTNHIFQNGPNHATIKEQICLRQFKKSSTLAPLLNLDFIYITAQNGIFAL